MKKIMIVITLLLTCFWCVNVKADGEDLMTVVDEEPATVEVEEKQEEVKEEKQEEVASEVKEEKEEKKEEVVSEFKEESKVEDAKKEVKEETKKEEVKEEAKAEDKNDDAKAEPTRDETVGKVNVVIIDSRTGEPVTTVEVLADAESNTTVTLSSLYSGMSVETVDGVKRYYLSETLYKHYFLGFFDNATDGNQITSNYSNNTLYPNLKTISCNSTYMNGAANYRLTLRAKADITDESTVYVYARFETVAKPNGKITINIIDTRTNEQAASFYSFATDSGNTRLKLTDAFPGINSSFKQTLNNKTYKFLGFYTEAENGQYIDTQFTPGDAYPELSTFKGYSITNVSNYALLLKTKTTVADDKEYSVYALWEEEKEPHTLTVKYHDVKPDGTNVVSTITRTVTPGTTWEQTETLDQIFSEEDSSRPYSGVHDENATTETDASHTYTFIGWYDAAENGNALSLTGDYAKALTELVVNSNNSITFKTTVGLDDDYTLNFYAYWDCVETSYLKMQNVNEVSKEGNTSWTNSNGMASSYTHTYEDPTDGPETHQFEYWKVYEVNADTEEETEYDGIEYCESCNSSEFTFDFTGEPGSLTTLVGKAYWKANVTVYLYDGNEMLGDPQSSFESVTVDTKPTKEGYRFLGWTDKDGNDITDLTFYPEDMGTNPKALEYYLYAKWQKLINITIIKEWDDDDDEKRPESVTIRFFTDDEYEDIVLSEENDWRCYFEGLPESNEDGSVINYSVEEVEVPEGYVVAYELEANDDEQIFTVHNVLGQGDGEPDEPTNNPQTGDNIGLYLVTLIGSLSGLVLCIKKYNFE